ncbi:MAG TPA: chalcone isomerase family protein [Anaeromyxobacteraceae bacterium]|nr:chalcone isomerase family protein [Anaeromyxobacteraceae bacterium]
MRSLAAALLVVALPARTADVAGVAVPASIVVDGTALLLNGAGVRTVDSVNRHHDHAATPGSRVFLKVKVYVGALYLPRKMNDPASIVALDQPKAVRLTYLRGVARAKILEALKGGFESNSKDQLAELLPKLKLLEPAIPEEVREGQVLSVTYIPGQGSVVGVDAGPPVTVEGKSFADALFRNWLGPKPLDDGLEALQGALLGR